MCFPVCSWAWGLQHSWITEEAVGILSETDRDAMGIESHALIHHYCEFPDMNWMTYGVWGGGVGDPSMPRFPDARREWNISYYCNWNPYLRTGKNYPHAPPAAYEAVNVHFRRAAQAIQEGNRVEAMRIAGVMLHYIQDSGSFPMVQPIHRKFNFAHEQMPELRDYAPRVLGATPEECGAALSRELKVMVEATITRVDEIAVKRGLPVSESIELCKKELMSPKVRRFVTDWVADDPESFEKSAVDCADLCSRLCADALASLLQFSTPEKVSEIPIGKELLFNGSFESDEDGDAFPDGWWIDWKDLNDKAGRVKSYSAGTHFERPVKDGTRSILVMFPPQAGIGITQTWRQALRVKEGQGFEASVAAMSKPSTQKAKLSVVFYDGKYRKIDIKASEQNVGKWTELNVSATAPAGAVWARVAMSVADASENVFWFDSIQLKRVK